MNASGGDAGSVEICVWGCAMCTFENEGDADRCAICLTPRRKTPVKQPAPFTPRSNSSGTSSSPHDQRTTKKAKTRAQRQIQAPLVAVGSSNEKEALRLKKKIDQMKELGIDLPSNDMIALLAKHCYSVMVAASAYFEQLATADASTSKQDMDTEQRITSAAVYFEKSFAREPYRLLGSKVMSATLNRSSVSMNTGDRLVLQAENAGKKRLRPGAAAGSSPASSSASSLSAGIVRIATMQNSLVRYY